MGSEIDWTLPCSKIDLTNDLVSSDFGTEIGKSGQIREQLGRLEGSAKLRHDEVDDGLEIRIKEVRFFLEGIQLQRLKVSRKAAQEVPGHSPFGTGCL